MRAPGLRGCLDACRKSAEICRVAAEKAAARRDEFIERAHRWEDAAQRITNPGVGRSSWWQA